MKFRVVFFLFSRSLGGRLFGSLGLENRVENRGIFGDVVDLEARIWRGESTTDLGPLTR